MAEAAQIPQPTLAMMEMLQTLAQPAVHALIEQGQRHSEDIQFFIDKMRSIQKLVGQWHTEFPDSDVAKRCASDLEALVTSPGSRKQP